MIVRYARFGQVGEQIAPVIAAESAGLEATAISHAIWPSVATGVLVYVATRLIDKYFFGGTRR